MSQKPSVGRIVHLTNSAEGCLAAIITAVHRDEADDECVSLQVFGLNGDTWGKSVSYYDGEEQPPNTWHWPERVD